MRESNLFRMSHGSKQKDIILGDFPCDIPFRFNEVDKVGAVLTRNSEKSEHGIPILRLYEGHYKMDYEAHEHTPAGNAAKVVADWLNEKSELDDASRYFVELFLWRWPGIRQDNDGLWHLSNKKLRQDSFLPPFFNCKGKAVHLDTKNEAFRQRVLDNSNLQVHDSGYCAKGEPCYLLDACITCPHFRTNKSFKNELRARATKLEEKRDFALESDNPRLAEICHQALGNIDNILSALADT